MFPFPAQPVYATAINLLCILTLLTACVSANNILLPTALPLLYESNFAPNGTAQAPYFRNVSAGGVWVLPSERFDIGGRRMSCECFSPDQTCCMPPDRSIAPFCISSDSSCCANTYCNSGESCCGTGCCPSDTNCTANGSGCCPRGQQCAATATATCYDALAPVCTPAFPPALGCCPSTLPYCRSYAPYGLGCFASSTLSMPNTTFPLTDTPITHAASSSQSSTATGGVDETTATQTITITLVALGSGRFSVIYPSLPLLPSSATSTSSGTTTVRVTTTTSTLNLPSTTISTPPSRFPTPKSTRTAATDSISTTTSVTPSSPIPHLSSTTITTPTRAPSTSTSTSTSTSPSALCFNPTLETDLPCALPTTDLSPPQTNTWTILATPRIQMSQASRRASTFLATVRSVLDGMRTRFEAAAESCWHAVDGGSAIRALCWTVVGVLGMGWVGRLVVVDFGWHGDARGALFLVM